MFCADCGKQINDDSNFCRFCGATQEFVSDEAPSRPSATISDEPRSVPQSQSRDTSGGKGKAIGIIAGVLLFMLIVGSLNAPDTNTTNSAEPAVDMMSDNMTVQDNTEATAAATANDGAEGAAPATAWVYTSDVDKVRGGTSYFASTTSTNTVHQDPPYDAATTMQMIVRRMPSSGTDVVLTISSGQMMCPSYDGCSGTVRFDDGPSQQVQFNGPADSSSDTIFVVGAKSFIAKLKKAKKVIIEKTLYEAGNPQFEFDVAGLRWER